MQLAVTGDRVELVVIGDCVDLVVPSDRAEESRKVQK
jgi:hypothetical protein